MHRNILNFVPALLVGCAFAPLAQASFHLMQIERVIGGVNGDVTAQAIQLRFRASFQNQLQLGRLVSRDAAGLNPIVICDITTSIPQTNAGTTVLITTSSFNAQTTPTAVPNYTMTAIPAARLAAGRITWESDTGVIYWSLSCGGSAYTGSNIGNIANDADGNFGPPFAGPLPSTGAIALRFTGSFSAMSLTNAGDYALTTGPAVFTNAAGASFTVNPPPPPCVADFNGDAVLNADDLADFITGYFNEPPDARCDFNADGTINADDLGDYITAFFNGC